MAASTIALASARLRRSSAADSPWAAAATGSLLPLLTAAGGGAPAPPERSTLRKCEAWHSRSPSSSASALGALPPACRFRV